MEENMDNGEEKKEETPMPEGGDMPAEGGEEKTDEAGEAPAVE